MTTFAERFVAELHGKPAPVTTEEDSRENHPDTIYEGGIDTIAENCNVYDMQEDDLDDSVPEVLQAGAGLYFFKDGSSAKLKYHFSGHWHAEVFMRGPVDAP